MKNKIELEYTLNCSSKVLFPRLSTASGLSEWFADDVSVRGKEYTFIWEGTTQVAEMILKKEHKFVRFHWLEDCNEDEKCYFEFKLNIDELTGDLALLITDFSEEGEMEDNIDLWDTQIAKLKHIIGL